MEITNEIKEKVVGQYIGSKANVVWYSGCEWEDGIWTIDGDLLSKMGLMNSLFLILKPLSAITDDEFKEMIKLLYSDFQSKTDFKIHRLEGMIFANVTGYKMVKLFWHGTFMLDDIEPIECYTKLALAVYQYLQSKGYDLPQYILGGKTLQEAGLAIYETN